MIVRKIIEIDEEKCNGCGQCITTCSEGALELINGKAKLVKDHYCDGFGDCIGTCPTGALTIQEREAEEFDFEATRTMLLETKGKQAVVDLERSHLKHQSKKPLTVLEQSQEQRTIQGCPGSQMEFHKKADKEAVPSFDNNGPAQAIASELNQWPIQLHLVQPNAEFFKNKELVVLSTCSPIASADIHWRFLRGRSAVVACPKLDNTSPYVSKLAAILSEPSIPKVLVVRMEVPCCGGLTSILAQAVKESGRPDLQMQEVTVGIHGNIC